MQETFLRVYNSFSRLDNTKNVSAWIYRIGTNICIDTLRRKSVRQTATLLPIGEQDPCDLMDRLPTTEMTPEEVVLKSELESQIERLLYDLPSKWKPLIFQYYVLEMSLEEMSIANCMPVGTIKSRVYRARNYLQRRFHLEVTE